jgi:hypothetical protein
MFTAPFMVVSKPTFVKGMANAVTAGTRQIMTRIMYTAILTLSQKKKKTLNLILKINKNVLLR